jgi:hypothetical protein
MQSTRYGYTPDQWERLVETGGDVLAEAAAAGDPSIKYGKLCEKVRWRTLIALEPGMNAFPHVLGDISRRSWASNGTLITALAVSSNSGRPSAGFFRLAEELDPEGFAAAPTQEAYWSDMVAKCHQANSRAAV